MGKHSASIRILGDSQLNTTDQANKHRRLHPIMGRQAKATNGETFVAVRNGKVQAESC